MLKCAGHRIDVVVVVSVTHTNTNTVFYNASQFNRDLSAWDVRIVADMTNMFFSTQGNSQSQSLCGYHWMQSSTAQLTFSNTLPQIAIDKDGKICHCPRGTYYQSRIRPPSTNPPAQLETCPPCPSGQYSSGGKVPATFCSDCPAGFYCVTPAVKEGCPLGGYCPMKSTFPKALKSGYYAVNALNNFTEAQGVAQKVCEGGYYCSGGSRIQCPSGSACPQGSSFPVVCPKGQYTNDAWLCVDCEAGHFCDRGIRMECTKSGTYCAPGSAVVANCRAGYVCTTPANETNCLDGSYCPLKSTGSIDCPVGFYCATPAVKAECPKGSYCLAKSMLPVACKSCAVGEGLVAACSVDVDTQCELCKDGEFSSGGTSTCEPCKANTISNVAKSACIPCKSCAVGEGVTSFCTGNNDTRCDPCVPGQFSPGGNSTCKWCGPGEYCPMGAYAPRPCTKGSFCDQATSTGENRIVWGTSETPCMSGRYCPSGTALPLDCAEGATCTVPASPELVFKPDIIDLIESEVNASNSKIVYKLSLSAQPNASVPVLIHVSIDSPDCYYHDKPKFQLESNLFVFGPHNYSHPQNVTISVDRLTSWYEGTHLASFKHSINTTDESFSNAFLRPVLVTFQDDSECVANARKFEDGKNPRKCGCMDGYYIVDADPMYCGSIIKCGMCPRAMVCDSASSSSGQDLTLAKVLPKMYRVHANSTIVEACPKPSAQCIGNATHGDDLCAEGHQGVFCMVCELNYVWSDGRCVHCESSHEGIMYGLLALVLLLMGLVAYFIGGHDFWRGAQRERLNLNREILTKYKSVVKLLQTLSKVTTLYPGVTFPAVFILVISKLDVFAYLDVNILPFNCMVPSSNFHDRLLLMTLAPLAFIAYMGLVYFYQCREVRREYDAAEKRSEKLGILKADCVYFMLVFMYTVFSLVATTIVQTFNYDDRLEDVTGESYLIADYSIRKSDSEHKAYVAYAVIMFVVYCIGIPAASLHFLWKHKTNIQALQECVLELSQKEDRERRLEKVAQSMYGLDWLNEEEEPSSGQECGKSNHMNEELPNDEEPQCSRAKRVLPRATKTVHFTNNPMREELPNKEPQHQELGVIKARIKTLRVQQEALLKNNPMLRGLAPLYQDYEAHFFYFEVIQFVVTLFLVAVAVYAPLSWNFCPILCFCRRLCTTTTGSTSSATFLITIELNVYLVFLSCCK